MNTFESSRQKLLNALTGARDITYIRSYGNIGDELIYAGTRQLFADLSYREIHIKDVESAGGHTAVIAGGGDWCNAYHHAIPPALPAIEERFEQVIVLPSSFDVSNDLVRDTLARTKALVFARERVSYEQIRGLCRADIAHDCAFYFDFRPYLRQGRGNLRAYRTDPEANLDAVPSDSIDISATCETLDEWLWTIARHETVETDRAHVMIAAALLGKHVVYYPSNYHKVSAIAAFSLSEFPVQMGSGREPLPPGRQGNGTTQPDPLGSTIQTRGLMRALLLSLPESELAYLLSHQLELLDWGCGMGDGVDVLAHAFPMSSAAGMDGSSLAIAKAREAFPSCEFLYTPDGSIPHPWDIIIAANCLEHFARPLDVVAMHLSHCRKLYIAMVPYDERPLMDQHLAQFREESFPAQVGNFARLFVAPIDISPAYSPDQHLVVVYGSPSYLEEWSTAPPDVSTLSSKAQLSDALLREELSQSYKQLAASQHRVDEVCKLVRNRDGSIAALHEQLNDQIATTERKLLRLLLQAQEVAKEHAQVAAERDRLGGELNFVYSTKAWRLTALYWRLRRHLLHGRLLSLHAYAFDRFKRQRTKICEPDLSLLRTPATPGLVSIVLPVYNGADMLHESVESILAQSYPKFELIAINDGSTDQTADILEEYARKDSRVRVVHQENRKIPRTLSRGSRLARGEYLTWTSHDNHLKPDFLQQMVDCLQRHPQWDMIYANQDIIGEDGLPLRNSDWYHGYQQPVGSEHIYFPTDPSELNTFPNNYVGAAFMYRSRVAALLGDYSTLRFTAEDYDYWMRVNQLMTLRHSDFEAPVYEYRLHVQSLTAHDEELGITRNRPKLIAFDDFRRDFCLSPLIWVVETTGSQPELKRTASRLREQIEKVGHLVYEVGQVDYSGWSRLWLPTVYIRLTDDPAGIGNPSPNIPENALKIVALVSKKELPDEVSADWDMCVAIGNQVSPRRLPTDYQGWFTVPEAETLFKAVDIRARSQHLELIEHNIAHPAPAQYKLSVIICAYRRLEGIVQAVTSVAHQSLTPNDYEVVVVNNDPDDKEFATHIEELRRQHFADCPDRLRLVVCPLLGLSHARNAGVSEARGEILCFLDDDALASVTWLERIWAAFEGHPDAGIIGGTIRLKVPEPRPSALLPGTESYWSQFVIKQDGYTEAKYWWEYPWGANWCARRIVLLEIGGFRTRYGRHGHNFAGGEEMVAASLAQNVGYLIGVIPEAEVLHNVSPARFTWNHMRQTMVNGTLANYYLQRDLYVPMQSSIAETLRTLTNPPPNHTIKGPRGAVSRHRWYQRMSHLQLLRQQLRDRRARKQKPIALVSRGK